MTQAADLVLSNGEVHTLEPDGDRTHEAVAVRDGRIVRVGPDYEVRFLEGVETRTVDLDGRVVLPGFTDAHTHLEHVGQYLLHADLSRTTSREDAIERLRANASEERDWILGFGYDESEWDDPRYLVREDLDRVSEDRPVAAMRVDAHTASLNSVALSRLGDSLPDEGVRSAGGEPTGVVVEEAVAPVTDLVGSGVEETRQLVTAARDRAHEVGVTGVHEMVRNSHAPRVYRELDRAGELGLRVRINYWRDHLDAAVETGLCTNQGCELVRVGGIKTYTDGSLGGRTAKVREPYADAPESDEGDDPTGRWVVESDDLRALVERADEEGFQVCAHAIGDVAIETTLSVYESVPGDGDQRHRIEHAELATDDQIDRMADAGVVASMQPNFLRWADDGGLYDRRLGPDRREWTNRLRAHADRGVDLAFGSDCMPIGPLYGVHQTVNAPVEAQRLSVTEALRAYTLGAARAGFDEDRLGTVEPDKLADLVVLESSPWDHPDRIREIDVAATVVGGEVVYNGSRSRNHS
jgi:predicted amidohydrolase YtcJ